MTTNEQPTFGFSLFDAFSILKRKWMTLAAFSFASIVIFSTIAVLTPNKYKAEIIVSPAESNESNSLSGVASSLSSVAALTGISVGSNKIDDLTIALETMLSRTFLTQFVEKHDILAELMADATWESERGELVFHDERYDSKAKKWRVNPETGESYKPTSWSYIPKLKEKITIAKNPETGIITISVDHISPLIAYRWVSSLVSDINNYMREKDIAEATRSIEYLRAEIGKSNLTEMQRVFYSLIEQQTRTRMIANVRPDYVLKIIDPAVIPEGKSSPNRVLMVIFGALLGAFLGAFYVIFRNLVLKRQY
jgi:uncharacterized protein involved in exopolysaccharide biosynthesis